LQDEYNNNDFVQEQGILDLDPARDPLTPMSPDLAPKSDDLRISMEESETDSNKVKFSSGVREIIPHEGPDDETTTPAVIPADDCIPSLFHRLTYFVDEAMKNAILDPVGELEVLHEGHLTWKIHNYGNMKDRSLSPEFELGGFKWFHNTHSMI
jgi:hypothetical protein